jgi:hypothetical protein
MRGVEAGYEEEDSLSSADLDEALRIFDVNTCFVLKVDQHAI